MTYYFMICLQIRCLQALGPSGSPLLLVDLNRWQFEDKSGTGAWAIAVDGERATHFPGGVGCTMQTEAVARFFGGEAMLEHLGYVLCSDSDTVVANFHPNALALGLGDAKRETPPFGPSLHRFLGVTHKIDEALQYCVAAHQDVWNRIKLAHDLDLMAGQRGRRHAQGVLDQFVKCQFLQRAGDLGVGLLHRNNLFDVIDVLLEPPCLLSEYRLLVSDLLQGSFEECGKPFAFRVVSEKFC